MAIAMEVFVVVKMGVSWIANLPEALNHAVSHPTTSRSSRSQVPTGRKFTQTVVVDSLYDNVPQGAIQAGVAP